MMWRRNERGESRSLVSNFDWGNARMNGSVVIFSPKPCVVVVYTLTENPIHRQRITVCGVVPLTNDRSSGINRQTNGSPTDNWRFSTQRSWTLAFIVSFSRVFYSIVYTYTYSFVEPSSPIKVEWWQIGFGCHSCSQHAVSFQDKCVSSGVQRTTEQGGKKVNSLLTNKRSWYRKKRVQFYLSDAHKDLYRYRASFFSIFFSPCCWNFLFHFFLSIYLFSFILSLNWRAPTTRPVSLSLSANALRGHRTKCCHPKSPFHTCIRGKRGTLLPNHRRRWPPFFDSKRLS